MSLAEVLEAGRPGNVGGTRLRPLLEPSKANYKYGGFSKWLKGSLFFGQKHIFQQSKKDSLAVFSRGNSTGSETIKPDPLPSGEMEAYFFVGHPLRWI